MPLLVGHTIESDDEVEVEAEEGSQSSSDSDSSGGGTSSATKRNKKKKKKRKKKKREKDDSADDEEDGEEEEEEEEELDPSFSLMAESSGALGEDEGAYAAAGWNFKGAMEILAAQDPRRAGTAALLDSRIAEKRKELLKRRKEERRKKARVDDNHDDGGGGARDAGEASGEGGSSGEEGEDQEEKGEETESEDKEDASASEGEEEKGLSSDVLRRMGGDPEEEEGDSEQEEAARRAEYFETSSLESNQAAQTFQSLNLSRPLLRAVETLGYSSPTLVQAMSIPHALAGRDLAASATTGSGKTAAFLLPILERLLFRPKRVSATRVLIVTPTRELAVQIQSMAGALARYTDIRSALIVGGSKNLRSQEAELRARPDIVVCTPGRMVDHITNSIGIHLDDVDILVLDEADRLLELGFEDEVQEIVKLCPRGRQTMLFSATMNTKVDTLMKLSLNRPVRVEATPANALAQRLEQEFIRIRKSREEDREAILLSLLSRTYREKVIVFFDTKVLAHRIMLILGLSGIKVAELHGNLTMTQRLEALERFKGGEVDVLVATDLAARGLDITGVHTVVNFEMPRAADTYVHRVGRTARAGSGGRAVTLIGEPRRLIMKEVLRRHAQGDGEGFVGGPVQARSVPQAVIDHYRTKVEGMEDEIRGILQQEKVDRDIRLADMEANKAQNVMDYHDEIQSRPAREWIVSNKRREEVKGLSKLNACGGDTSAGLPSSSSLNNSTLVKETKKKKDGKDGHKLNRKKRRRLELQKVMEREDGGGMSEAKMRLVAKKAKKQAHEKQMAYDTKPLGETRGTMRTLEVGGMSERSLSSRSRKKESTPTFTEFDPDMHLRKGGKLGKGKFKSKAKFKRRR